VQAKIYLANGKKSEAINILRDVIFANDPTYSTLCLFLILNENLFTDYRELSVLFDHVLANNKFEKEIRNLLIYKKSLLNSNFVAESELLEGIRPLLNTETLWKPHALLLLGDYFLSKQEYLKAKEFYTQILSINNLQKDLYNQARSQLSFIAHD
jgi:tetratricopeptide (TPR) repeat protein